MMRWLTENWGFIAGIAAVIGGGFKLYYTIERQLALLRQSLSGELKGIQKDIKRLEEKQDKYNNLQERTLKNEMEIKHIKEHLK